MVSQVLRSSGFFILAAILIGIITGCSGGSGSNNPIMPGSLFEKASPENPESMPIIVFDGETALGVIGGYTLTISPDGKNAELVPIRSTAVGEAYIVSGRNYFVTFLCKDCFRISGLGYEIGKLIVKFSIRHPLPKGDTVSPPNGKNRLDLDLFDLALVVVPESQTPVHYALSNLDVYDGYISNPDGFTTELANVTGNPGAMPYQLILDDGLSIPPMRTYNRFEMGASKDFEVKFPVQSGETLVFDLYLTFGYGCSAVLTDRLNPKYYNPEFNRKAAWKVKVEPVSWVGSDPSTVKINVYDWNHGATVNPNYPDPNNTNQIRSLSDVQNVTVEVPGMTNSIITADLTDSTTNGWDDPLTYSATFTNENGLTPGLYRGIIKVVDSRIPGDPYASDSLMHAPDNNTGIESYAIPEFVTYQTFIATILPPDMIYIPAGPFIMGGWVFNEGGIGPFPVNLPAFYISDHETTNAEYKEFIDATGYPVPSDWSGNMYPTGKADHPVIFVSWYDAVAYCDWAGLRLPTEPEWEKAARGTDGRVYPWGDGWDENKCRNGLNYDPVTYTCNAWDYPSGRSPYGLYNMAGNVWEWTADWYSITSYSGYKDGNLSPPSSPPFRVVRGGSWDRTDLDAFRCAFRNCNNPTGRYSNRGFRCAGTL